MTNQERPGGGPVGSAEEIAAASAQPPLIGLAPARRTFTVEQKRALLEEYDATEPVDRGALLRRRHLTTATLRRWRKMLETPPGAGDVTDGPAVADGASPQPAATVSVAPAAVGASESEPAGSEEPEGEPVGPGESSGEPAGPAVARPVVGDRAAWSQTLQLQRVLTRQQATVSATRPWQRDDRTEVARADEAAESS